MFAPITYSPPLVRSVYVILIWYEGQTSPEVQNKGISGPTKRQKGLMFSKNVLKIIIWYCTLFLQSDCRDTQKLGLIHNDGGSA